jgi:fatty acid desaturase
MNDFPKYSGKIAIPTIALACTLFLGHLLMMLLAFNELIPIWFGVVVNTVICYCLYTVHHEATHGNISGRKTALLWIDRVLGSIAGVFIDLSFSGYSKAHLAHHMNTNGPKDTVIDAHFNSAAMNAKRYARTTLIKYISIIPIKKVVYFLFEKLLTRESKIGAKLMLKKYPKISKLNKYTFSFTLLAFFTEYGLYLFYLWYLPIILYPIINMVLHDWLPHNVYDKDGKRATGRYLDTRIITWPGSHIVTCAQDYHLIHHMYQEIPFYSYKKVYQLIEKDLIENGSVIQKVKIKKFF